MRVAAPVTALALILAGAGPGQAQDVFEDWQGNANAELTGLNLQRAIRVEQIENGFFERPPRQRTIIHGGVHNGPETNRTTPIGNLKETSIRLEDNCTGDVPCEVQVETQLNGSQANDQADQQAQLNEPDADGAQTTQNNMGENGDNVEME